MFPSPKFLSPNKQYEILLPLRNNITAIYNRLPRTFVILRHLGVFLALGETRDRCKLPFSAWNFRGGIAVVVMTFLFAITVVTGCVFGCVKCFKYSVRAARRQNHPQTRAPGAAVNEHMVQFPSNEKLMLA